MNYTYLFAGIAIGSIVPWILLLAFVGKKNKQTEEAMERANRPNELLSERNQIGEREAMALTGINASLALIADNISSRKEMGSMREWIKQAAPMLSVASCIVIDEAPQRLEEMAGCRAVLEMCPIDFTISQPS